MKIRKLQLKNIGVFDDETIEFQPCPVKDKAEIHILTGQNGSGKSTILMALASAFEYLPDPHEKLKIEKDFINQWTVLMQDAGQKNDKEKQLFAPFQGLLSLLEDRVRKGDIATIGKAASYFGKRYRFYEYLDSKEGFKSYSSVTFDNSLSSILYGCQCGATHSFHQDDMLKLYGELISEEETLPNVMFNSVPFAYSGYRRIKDEKIELGREINESPLYQSLEFVKDESSRFTINQWLGRNLSKRALAKEENNSDSKLYDENIKNLEKVISDVIGREIKFKLKTDLSLVLIEQHKNAERELNFDVLPDGLKSLISWIGDLLMRLDSLKWENDTPIFERDIILFLDEIEVHLHPAWQRKVLPVVQKLFKNAQIFVSTHSPFVVNSVDNAWVYKLELENGKAKVAPPIRSEDGYSYQTVLREIFDIDKRFGEEAQKELDSFYMQSKAILNANGNGKVSKEKFLAIANHLASQSAELQSLVFLELARLSKETGEPYQI